MVELRKVDAIIIVLCVAVLAFGVWQMTKARSPVDGQLAVASKPYELAAGDNTIGAVTVTTILDPEQFLFDVGDLCTAVDGFLVRGDLLVNNAIVTTTLSVGTNISMTDGYIFNSQGAVTVTDQLQVDSQLVAKNGIAATGGITTASGGALVMTAGSIWDDSRYLYLMDDVFIGGATQLNGPITSTAGLLQLGNPSVVTGTLGVSSQINAANGVAVTGNVTVSADLDVAGNAMSTSGSFRINDPTLVTGTLGVSSQINAANGVAVTGAVTATGALSGASIAVTGAASWATFLSGGIPAPAAYITVTTNSYITPTYTLQPITSADAVFTANLAAGAAGRLLILWNVANTTITISDTGTIMLSADWAGTQYDTLTLISDGTNWLELSRSTN